MIDSIPQAPGVALPVLRLAPYLCPRYSANGAYIIIHILRLVLFFYKNYNMNYSEVEDMGYMMVKEAIGKCGATP